MEQFYSATVNGDVPAIKEAKADIESNTFWTLNKIFTGADDYIQRLNNHLDKELECYNIGLVAHERTKILSKHGKIILKFLGQKV
jgi:hypothetical protein